MRYIFLLLLLFPVIMRAQQTTIKEQIYFPVASSELADADKQRLVNLTRSFEGKVITGIWVLGHTDNTGSLEYNQQLSEKRAHAVANFLQTVLPLKIQIDFRGETAPVAANENEPGKQLNRRTEIIITLTEKKPELLAVQPYKKIKESQVFVVNVGKDSIRIKANEGSSLIIPPGSLVHKDGKPAAGEVTITIREYLTVGDMVLAGLHTQYQDGFLETRGTIELLYMQGKDTLHINSKVPVEVRIPTKNPTKGMQVFASANPDSAWVNTGRPFNVKLGGWTWPAPRVSFDDYTNDIRAMAQNMAVGRSWTETDSYSGNRTLRNKFKPENFLKRSEVTFTKVDAFTIKIRAKLLHRGFARRKGYVTDKKLDTTYIVVNIPHEYFASVTTTAMCNIDTYRKLPQETYVIKTPGVTGLRLAAVPAITPAVIMANEIEPGVYEIRMAKDAGFTVIAMGTKGDLYYYGKTVVPAFNNEVAVVQIKELADPSELNAQVVAVK